MSAIDGIARAGRDVGRTNADFTVWHIGDQPPARWSTRWWDNDIGGGTSVRS